MDFDGWLRRQERRIIAELEQALEDRRQLEIARRRAEDPSEKRSGEWFLTVRGVGTGHKRTGTMPIDGPPYVVPRMEDAR